MIRKLRYAILCTFLSLIALSPVWAGDEYNLDSTPNALIHSPQPTDFWVNHISSQPFAESTKVEIWQVTSSGIKVKLLGTAQPMASNRVGMGLKAKITPAATGEGFFQAFITLADHSQHTSGIRKINYIDPKEAMVELKKCMDKTHALSATVPPKTFTSQECATQGGHVSSASLSCGVGRPTPQSVCDSGLPLGSVTGMLCNCVCCK